MMRRGNKSPVESGNGKVKVNKSYEVESIHKFFEKASKIHWNVHKTIFECLAAFLRVIKLAFLEFGTDMFH